MSLAVRKITFSKWNQRKILEGELPSADAITNCMKTTRNTLSTWLIADPTELEDAVLAIISPFKSLDTIDVVTIELSLLQDNNLELKASPGITHYAAFRDKHHDISNLDYDSLGRAANVIVTSIKQNSRVRFTHAKLKKILLQGIDDGKIIETELDESLQEKIDAYRQSICT